MTTDPRYSDGWITAEQLQSLDLPGDVHYRSILRVTDGRVWSAPMGTPDPWPPEEAHLWVHIAARGGDA